MYSRNTWEKRNSGYTVPPGYDGSRFRRRRRNAENGTSEEVILVPDSGFAPGGDELSVSGIPTSKGIRNQRRQSAIAENEPEEYPLTPESPDPASIDAEQPPAQPKVGEKLSGILGKFGFGNKISSDELLLCAIIFIIASDTDNEERNVGDILLILALLLGIR